MFADFKKAFFKENEAKTKIPKEVLMSLSKNLPNGFIYTEIDNGMVGITPLESDIKIGGFKFDLKDEVFKDFTPSNVNETIEFLYRTQRKYEITLTDEDSIIINGTLFKVGEIIEKPFEEVEKGVHKMVIIPQPFQPPFEVSLEGDEVIKKFIVERQPYADMNKSLFKSINNDSFELSYIIDERKLQLQINFKLNIDKASDVAETIEVLKLYRACITGNIKLLGEKISDRKINHSEEESVAETIKFWRKVLKLEDILKVKFSPKSQLEIEDILLIEQLFRTLVEKKPFKEYITLNEMTLAGTNEMNIEDLLVKEGLSLSFHQNTDLVVLGVNLNLFSIVSFFDLRVASFKLLKENEQSQTYILFIEPIEGRKIYQSSIHFCSNSEIKDYKMDINELQNAEVLTVN